MAREPAYFSHDAVRQINSHWLFCTVCTLWTITSTLGSHKQFLYLVSFRRYVYV